MRVSGVQPYSYGQKRVSFTGEKERKFLKSAIEKQTDWRLIRSIKIGAFKKIPEEDIKHPDITDAFTKRINKEKEKYPDFEEAGQGFRDAYELLLEPFLKKD